MTKNPNKARIGQSHGRARVTESDVLAIREWADACARAGMTPPYKAKAAEYNVSEGSLRDIVARRTWTHLEGPAPAPRREQRAGFPPDVDLTAELLRDQLAKHLQRSGGMLPRSRDTLPDFACAWSAIAFRIREGSVSGLTAPTFTRWMVTLVRPADEVAEGDGNAVPGTEEWEPGPRHRNRRTRDLAGQRVGSLLVVRQAPKRNGFKGAHWLCNCDCGRTTVVNAISLINGFSRSCGCSSPRRMRWVIREADEGLAPTPHGVPVRHFPREVAVTEDLLRDQLAKHLQRSGGMLPRLANHLPDFDATWKAVEERIRSGRVPGITAKNRMQWMLTVLRRADEADESEPARLSEAPAPLLRTTRKTRDLAGKRFGKLVADCRAPTRPGRSGACWLCRCDCGRSATVMAQELLVGGTKSCGCASPSKMRWVMLDADAGSVT